MTFVLETQEYRPDVADSLAQEIEHAISVMPLNFPERLALRELAREHYRSRPPFDPTYCRGYDSHVYPCARLCWIATVVGVEVPMQ